MPPRKKTTATPKQRSKPADADRPSSMLYGVHKADGYRFTIGAFDRDLTVIVLHEPSGWSGDLNYGLNEVDEQLTELAALGVAYDGRDDPKYEMDGSVWQFRPGKPHYYHDADANGQVHWVAHQIKEVLERHGYGDLMRLFEAEDEAGFKALDDAPITY